jgi:hypothetical protein
MMTTLAQFYEFARCARKLLVGLVVAIALAVLVPPTSARELRPPPLIHAGQPASPLRQSEVAVTTQSNNQLSPAIAAGSSGYLVAWAHETSATNHDIYFRRLSSDGTPLGSPVGLATGVQFEGNPAVAYNPTDNEYLVVWEYAFSASDHDIYARRISGSGAPLGGTFVVVNSGTNESNPVVTFNQEAGQYLVVYEYQAAGGNQDIYARRVGGDGTLPGSIIPVATGSTDQSAPATAAGGSYLVVWQVAHPTSGEYDIYGQRVDAYGSLSGGSIAISTWQYDQLKPRLAFNAAAGEWLVVWEDHHWGWGAYRDIYGQRVNYNGTLDGGNFGIAWGNNRENPDVAYNSTGSEYMVVWEYVLSASDHDVYRRRVSANGSLLDSETAVSRGSAFEGHPAVAADANRAYVAVWEDGRNQLLNGLDLYAERLAPYLLSGGVYAGSVGDTGTPLAGVTVQLGCADNPDDFGNQISVTQTGATGSFSLPSYHTCEYYQLRETDPTDYTSNGATSVDGVVVNSNQIRYAAPLAGKTLSGNRFFDAPPTPIDTTPPGTWAAFSPTGWQTVQSVPVSVRVEDGDSGLDVGTAQYAYSTNGGFSWSSWLPAACTSSGGDTSPQTVSTTVAFGQDGGPGAQNLVRFRISDRAGNVGSSPNYTVLIDTVPPPNPASLFSPSHSVATWSNNNRVTAQWSGAVDDRSGLAGYSYEWSQSPTTLPGPWVDTSSVVVTSSPLADANNWYFHLRAIDVAGNAATSALHLGPFYIDTTPPTSWMTALAPAQDQLVFNVSWGGSAGGGAPITGYTLTVGDQYQGNVTLNDWLVDVNQTGAAFTGQRGHTYYFHVRARDAAGNLEAYHSIADTSTTVGKDITVSVKDESGGSKIGAKVYHNGGYVGKTGSGGTLTVHTALLGDQLAATYQVALINTPKLVHAYDETSNWAWRVHLTSVGLDAQGNPQLHTVTNSNVVQTLVVRKDQTLVGGNMVISIQWDADPATIADVAEGARRASAFLYDVTDGQMIWENIGIYDNAKHYDNCDMRLKITNSYRPNASTPGATRGTEHHIFMVRYQGPQAWSSTTFTRTAIHEYGHYALSLLDEYLDRNGVITDTAYCTLNRNDPALPEARRASIMDDQVNSSEFCSGADPAHPHNTNTHHDAVYGEPIWDTVKDHLADWQSPARWTILRPDDRGQVMAGPAAIPVLDWVHVYTDDTNTGACAPFTVTASYNGSQQAMAWAEVWLDRPAPLEDFWEGRLNEFGQADIVGAHTGDTVRFLQTIKTALDPMTVSAEAAVTCAGLTAQSTGEATPVPFTLNVQVIPLGGSQFEARVAADTPLAGAPVVEVAQEGTGEARPLAVSYAGGLNAYVGQETLDPNLPLTGYVWATATDAGGRTTQVWQPFNLVPASTDLTTNLYSDDGRFELVLPEGGLTGTPYLAIQSVSAAAVNGAGWSFLSPAYQVIASSGQTVLDSPAHVQLYLDPNQTIGAGAALYRWDDVAGEWQPLPTYIDSDRKMASAPTDRLGTFAMLTSSEAGSQPVYLPIILKNATSDP